MCWQEGQGADLPWLLAIARTAFKAYCDRLNGFSWIGQASPKIRSMVKLTLLT